MKLPPLHPHFRLEDGRCIFLNTYTITYISEIPNKYDLNKLNNEGAFLPDLKICPIVKSNKTSLIIEPHPDDLVLSCTGLVLERLRAGDRVYSLTCFPKTSLKTFPWYDKIPITQEEYDRIRLNEHQIALGVIDVGLVNLNLEGGLRRGYNSIYDPLRTDDCVLIHSLTHSIRTALDSLSVSELIVPLAIKNHIDHMLALQASKPLFNHIESVIFYEEYPYCSDRRATSNSISSLQTTHRLKPFFISVTSTIATKATLAMLYRTQFDDVDKSYMEARFRDLAQIVAEENRHTTGDNQYYIERYWVKR